MGFYDNLQNVAVNILKKYGQQLTFTRKTVGDYDATTGTATSIESTYKGYGAILEYSSKDMADGSILSGDKKIIIEYVKQRPVVNDIVTVDGINYNIIAVKEVNPAGINVYSELQARVGKE